MRFLQTIPTRIAWPREHGHSFGILRRMSSPPLGLPGFLAIYFLVCCLAIPSAGAAKPQFSPVVQSIPLTFPRDFGAHPAFRNEWWYVTGWLETPDKKPLGFQITFFRVATEHDRTNPSRFAPNQLIIAHAALSDRFGEDFAVEGYLKNPYS